PWELIRNAQITFYPVIHVKDYFEGATGRKIRTEMSYAVVTDIVPIGTVSPQFDLINRLCDDREVLERLDEQVASASSLKQGVLEAGPVVDEKGTLSEGNKKTELSKLLGDDEDEEDS